MVKQIGNRLRGRPLAPVALSRFRLAGFARRILDGRQPDGRAYRRRLWLEGWFARMMYLSLYKMHELALHGFWKIALDTARAA